MNGKLPSLRVLIVENDRDMLDLLDDEIREIGHKVIRASMHSHAIRRASEQRLDVIIVEVGHQEGGIETLASLRRLQPKAAIIAMTSFGTERTVRDVFKRGADYFITKPIQMESLRDFVTYMAAEKYKFPEEPMTHPQGTDKEVRKC